MSEAEMREGDRMTHRERRRQERGEGGQEMGRREKGNNEEVET